MSDARLFGTWRLATWEARAAADQRLLQEPFGPDPVGLLTYTPDGVVQGQMMPRARPGFDQLRAEAIDFDTGSSQEHAAAFNTYVAYAGRYVADPVERTVKHRLTVALIPGWDGRELTRAYTVTENSLTLQTPTRTINEVEQVGVLRWTRLRL